jgi:hypothetical protein
MLEKDRLIKTSRIVVRSGFIVNRLFLAAVVSGLLLSLLFSSPLTKLLVQQSPGGDARSEMTGLRLMLLLGIAMSVAIDRLFVALTQIIETARAGDPFIGANARRLQTIGWALLGLHILDIPEHGHGDSRLGFFCRRVAGGVDGVCPQPRIRGWIGHA